MAELKVRTCKGPRNIKVDGTVAGYRAICGSTNIKIVQPSPDWLTYFCYDCFWTNVEAAEHPNQLEFELKQLLAHADQTFGTLGMEAPDDMPESVRSLFVGEPSD